MTPLTSYISGARLPETTLRLQAGPLTLRYEDGMLRYIRHGDHDLIQGIYAAVRDETWATVLPTYVLKTVERKPQAFRLEIGATYLRRDVDFRATLTIEGTAEGTVRFTFNGVANRTFNRNRIGFCVLHPLTAAGAEARVEHADGSVLNVRLPVNIVSEQPVPPFFDLAALEHQVTPTLWARVTFEGDLFEMEDQRNWTDASFKTYCTPLRLPYPVEVPVGTTITQSVTVYVNDTGEAAVEPQDEVLPRLELPSRRNSMFRLGISLPSDRTELSELEVQHLRALKLDHLRAELLFSSDHWIDSLRLAAYEANRLGLPLLIALVLTDDAQAELLRLHTQLGKYQPTVEAWLVFHTTRHATPPGLVPLVREHLEGYSSAQFLAGANTDYIFLNRAPPPSTGIDGATLAINPQPHAFDNASLIETLQTQTVLARQVSKRMSGLEVTLSPITLKPRFNPYAGTRREAESPGVLPASADPRQIALFGAAWTVGSLAALVDSGVVARATYYEATGPLGLMERESGSPDPERFPSLPGAVFPLYHVFKSVAGFKGGEVAPLNSSDPLTAGGLVLSTEGRSLLLIANFTPEQRTALVTGPRNAVQVRSLEPGNVMDAMREPEAFAARPGSKVAPEDKRLRLNLEPYAILFVDAEEAL